MSYKLFLELMLLFDPSSSGLMTFGLDAEFSTPSPEVKGKVQKFGKQFGLTVEAIDALMTVVKCMTFP